MIDTVGTVGTARHIDLIVALENMAHSQHASADDLKDLASWLEEVKPPSSIEKTIYLLLDLPVVFK